MKRLLLISTLLLFFACQKSVNMQQVESPDGTLSLTFRLNEGAPEYEVARFNRTIINPSKLGFVLKEADSLTSFRVTNSALTSFDETWTQVWGEKKEIRNHYNELRVQLQEINRPRRKMTVVFRLFDDGLGFRYELPEQPNLATFDIMDELTEFNLADDATAWWIPAYGWNRYEYLYQATKTSELDTVHTPVTFETPNGLFLSIHEAALTDYASMTLRNIGGTALKADLVPWSDGVRVKAQTPMVTPWRTIQIADDAGGLITSCLILNLNEPNKLEDTSWIKPAKYVGIWWDMHLNTATWGSGPMHGATTERTMRYIDFAAKYGFAGVLVEGWNIGWDGDWVKYGDGFQFTAPYPDFDIEKVTRYAAEKGVQLIGHNETGAAVLNYEKQLQDAFQFYEKLGVHVVKTGYVGNDPSIKRIDEKGEEQWEWHHGQFMVRHYRKVIEEAARHNIMLDVHEPIKDTGIRRTYPNMMTREGARGQEYHAWDPDGGNPPDHETILPFTRLLAGPMDFTPGIFDLLFDRARPNNRVNTTLAKQLALYVVLYSPLHMAADLPENYEANRKPFQFILDVPTDWQDTRVLHARIGDYVTIVRQDRHSDDWYLGSVTDENGRNLQTTLSFLEPNLRYVAEIYRDGADADWQANPYSIEIIEMLVTQNSNLTLRLAPGGGQAIRFRKASEADVQRLSR
ncbi:glycoside hydrolase family 97 protein [candidate division KSB1 bacterium]|nr:glycoside hydrolase family 97 protein [candidate division KSB1 bacterium]RQW09601.1 MAG: glycoside hydrolase family 97 protein [candidate division KSB1 bacterium]